MTIDEAKEWLKLAVPIKALTQEEFATFIKAVNLAVDTMEKYQEIEQIINCPLDIQEDVFRYKAIVEAMKENPNSESCPDRCIDCKYFDERSYYAENTIAVSPVAVGSCKKCERNFVSSDPYNQVPSWCPLKGEKTNENS